MKRILVFITAANQVLLFLGILAALVLLVIALFDEFGSHRRRGVPVQNVTEAGHPPEVTVVDFLGRHHGLYLFGVAREFAQPPRGMTAMKAESSYAGVAGYRSNYLNVTFSDETGVRRTLLPQDGMIVRWAIASDSEDRHPGIPAHLFTCVLEDTNNNRELDSGDRQTLLLVREDLSGEDMRIDDVNDFDVLAGGELLVTTGRGGATQAWLVDVASFTRRAIAWERE